MTTIYAECANCHTELVWIPRADLGRGRGVWNHVANVHRCRLPEPALPPYDPEAPEVASLNMLASAVLFGLCVVVPMCFILWEWIS